MKAVTCTNAKLEVIDRRKSLHTSTESRRM